MNKSEYRTISAIIRRINRALKPHQRLRISRKNSQFEQAFGRFFVWDDLNCRPIETYVNIEELARRLGVLGAHEVQDAPPAN